MPTSLLRRGPPRWLRAPVCVTGWSRSRSRAQDRGARERAGCRTPDADARLARIRELYGEGKLTEAAKELVALRAALPDADRRLPPELQKWPATVEP